MTPPSRHAAPLPVEETSISKTCHAQTLAAVDPRIGPFDAGEEDEADDAGLDFIDEAVSELRPVKATQLQPASQPTSQTENIVYGRVFSELSGDLEMAEEVALCFRRGREKDEAAELMERHIEKLEREIHELKSRDGRQPRRRRLVDVDTNDWMTDEEEEEEEEVEEESEGIADPSRASSPRSVPGGEWDGFEKNETSLTSGLLRHMNQARSWAPLICSGSGSERAETMTAALANPLTAKTPPLTANLCSADSSAAPRPSMRA